VRLAANPSHLEDVAPWSRARPARGCASATTSRSAPGPASADPRRRGAGRPGCRGRDPQFFAAARLPPAAPCTSSSTTRSASPPIRATPAPPSTDHVAKMSQCRSPRNGDDPEVVLPVGPSYRLDPRSLKATCSSRWLLPPAGHKRDEPLFHFSTPSTARFAGHPSFGPLTPTSSCASAHYAARAEAITAEYSPARRKNLAKAKARAAASRPAPQ